MSERGIMGVGLHGIFVVVTLLIGLACQLAANFFGARVYEELDRGGSSMRDERLFKFQSFTMHLEKFKEYERRYPSGSLHRYAQGFFIAAALFLLTAAVEIGIL
jgi:hypothetical protein